MSRLDVYSDVICPWCYIGKRHMEVALAQVAADGHRFEVSWRPFQLNPDMPANGVERDSYRRSQSSAAWSGRANSTHKSRVPPKRPGCKSDTT